MSESEGFAPKIARVTVNVLSGKDTRLKNLASLSRWMKNAARQGAEGIDAVRKTFSGNKE